MSKIEIDNKDIISIVSTIKTVSAALKDDGKTGLSGALDSVIAVIGEYVYEQEAKS